MAAIIRVRLPSPQACITVISLSVYNRPSVISKPRNRLKGRMSCAIFGTPNASRESTKFVGILPSTASPNTLTVF